MRILTNTESVCSVCGFKLWYPVAVLQVSTLGIYSDNRFPGRSLLMLNEHRTSFSELEPELLMPFVLDAQKVGRALKEITAATKINYAVLGNAEPHLHWHIIPRTPGDPLPARSPWNDPRPPGPLREEQITNLTEALRTTLRDQHN